MKKLFESGNNFNGSFVWVQPIPTDRPLTVLSFEFSLLKFASPSWTRFELLRANWLCDRTHEHAMFSE